MHSSVVHAAVARPVDPPLSLSAVCSTPPLAPGLITVDVMPVKDDEVHKRS